MANSDWEIVDNDVSAKQQISNPSDWEIVPQESNNKIPQEGLGTSLALAVPRVATDVSKGVYNLAQNIPSYYREAKTEAPIAAMSAALNPKNALQQATAGVLQGINDIAKWPQQISNYATNRLNLLPKEVNNAVNYATPPDTTSAINSLYGQGQNPGDKFIRGITSLIPQFAMGSELGKVIEPSSIASKIVPTKNSIKNTILNTHDALENDATSAFNDVSKGVNDRSITQVPIESGFINGLKKYFPDTKASNSLLNNASTGNYNALRDLQSDLYKRGKKNLGSDLTADNNLGEEMLDRRNDINQSISNHLIDTGNNDLNDKLNQARSDWRTLQNVYYNKNMNNAIVNMVNKDYRKIPNNLIDVLKEDSKPMKELINFHPGLQNSIYKYNISRNALSHLKNIGLSATGIGGLGLGAYATYKELQNGNH
jgi:hypothetical protein